MFLFDAMDTIFPLMFIAVAGLVVFTFAKGIGQWNKNNQSPRLIVEATVVANAAMMHASTTYYVTFEVESGDRMEMNVGGQDYGMLTEGDVGKLTFQGTRYLNFERY